LNLFQHPFIILIPDLFVLYHVQAQNRSLIWSITTPFLRQKTSFILPFSSTKPVLSTSTLPTMPKAGTLGTGYIERLRMTRKQHLIMHKASDRFTYP